MSVLEMSQPTAVFSQGDTEETVAPYRAVSKAAVVSLFLGMLTFLPGAIWQLATLMFVIYGQISSWVPWTLFLGLVLVPLGGCFVGQIILYRKRPKMANLVMLIGLALLVPGGIWAIGLTGPGLLLLPLIGMVLGLVGWSGIRRYPSELTGIFPAVVGTFLGISFFVGGATVQAYVYATEVPEGYERIAFDVLKASSRQPDFPPEEAQALDGRKVFIKGYIYPGQQRYDLKSFVLVPDLGTCCFGGSPKKTHMIQVTLNGNETVDYSMTKRGIAGILKVDHTFKPVVGRPGVYYELTADYAK